MQSISTFRENRVPASISAHPRSHPIPTMLKPRLLNTVLLSTVPLSAMPLSTMPC